MFFAPYFIVVLPELPLFGLVGVLHARVHLHQHNSAWALVLVPAYCLMAPLALIWLIQMLVLLL